MRWTIDHEEWPADTLGRGACVVDPAGTHLFVTMVGPVRPGENYQGDLCAALDLATGEVEARGVLPSFSATYEFQQSLRPADHVFLSAAQGQDEAHSLFVSLVKREFRLESVGMVDEPFAGLSLTGTNFLKIARDGQRLARYECDASGTREVAVASAEAVLPEGLRFVGRPGFADRNHLLVAAAEEEWSEEAVHFVFDASSLRPKHALSYGRTVGVDAIALGDGTWLTVEGDDVLRWEARL